MTDKMRVLPPQLVDLVSQFIEHELIDIAKYDNREAFDESTLSGAIQLAADIYRSGYDDGMRAQSAVDWAQRRLIRARTPVGGPS